MDAQKFFSIGNITKKETLRLAEIPSRCQSLILESTEPYPGYHGTTIPDRLEPDSLFFVCKQEYTDDRIIRAIMAIKKSLAEHFDAAPGNLYLNNTFTQIIRIKFLKYKDVPALAKAFTEQGIEFTKKRKINLFDTLINIRKHFSIEKSVEGIYHDLDIKEFSYLQIPKPIAWDSFEEMTQKIKYNVEENNFDAALCTMYDEHGILDFVRIYDQNFRLGKLIFIREKYLDYIKNN
jgi:hypothetical protein